MKFVVCGVIQNKFKSVLTQIVIDAMTEDQAVERFYKLTSVIEDVEIPYRPLATSTEGAIYGESY